MKSARNIFIGPYLWGRLFPLIELIVFVGILLVPPVYAVPGQANFQSDNLYLSREGVLTLKPTEFVAAFGCTTSANCTGAGTDAGTYSANNTTEAKTNGGTPYQIWATGTAANTSFYLGLDQPFNNLNIDIGTADVGSTAITVQFWNGTAWTAVSGQTETPSSTYLTADEKITWTTPATWAAKVLSGSPPVATSLYWVRLVGTTNATTAPTANFTTPTTGNRLYVYGQSGDASPALFINDLANVGIGTTAPIAGLDLTKGYGVATAGEQYGARIQTSYGIVDSSLKQGLRLTTSATLTSGTLSTMEGLLILNQGFGNGGTTTDSHGIWVRNDVSTGHTITTAYGATIQDGTGAGAITTQKGILVNALTKGTNNVGIAIGEATGTKNTNLLIGTTTAPTGSYSVYNSSADNNYFAGNVGIGTTGPLSKLSVGGIGDTIYAIYGTGADIGVYGSGSFGGYGVYGVASSGYGVFGSGDTGVRGYGDTYGVYGYASSSYGVYGSSDTGTSGYFTSATGYALTTGTGNVGIGTGTPAVNLDVVKATSPGDALHIQIGTRNWYLGNGSVDDQWLRLSSTNGTITYTDLAVGKLYFNTNGGAVANAVCSTNAGSGTLGSCSSSIRYKKDVQPFSTGLDAVLKLKPVTFTWKYNDQKDYGLIAEDVEKLNPLFVSYVDGKVDGVKYDRLTAVLANAIKEQQNLIQEQGKTIDNQAQQITTLTNKLDQQQSQIDDLFKAVDELKNR